MENTRAKQLVPALLDITNNISVKFIFGPQTIQVRVYFKFEAEVTHDIVFNFLSRVNLLLKEGERVFITCTGNDGYMDIL